MICLVNEQIEFGVHIAPEGMDFEQVKSLCILVEELGYSFFTVADHFQNMWEPDGSTNHPLEAWTLLGGLASVTRKIKLGTVVSCAHYRHPTVLAKMATTVDIISGGRLIFGIGAGWHQKEFEGFLGEFPTTKKRMDGLEDALNIAKSMFINDRTNYEGRVYSAKNTMNSPLPTQRPIPILVGGAGMKRTLKFAAKYADISHFVHGSEPDEEIDMRIAALKGHCKAAGRDYSELKKSSTMQVNFNPTQSDIDAHAKIQSFWTGIPFEEMKKMVDVKEVYPGPEEIIHKVEKSIGKGITVFLNIFKSEEDIKVFANLMKKI
jgi:alkanesulfonate monooxygenase SsuD/methylene tetrahydromethanopterin reductase-like flavin-dependent oxidoreductase (luciferase family)